VTAPQIMCIPPPALPLPVTLFPVMFIITGAAPVPGPTVQGSLPATAEVKVNNTPPPSPRAVLFTTVREVPMYRRQLHHSPPPAPPATLPWKVAGPSRRSVPLLF
jgi:hypothetical protein